jgi:hypothetical protein
MLDATSANSSLEINSGFSIILSNSSNVIPNLFNNSSLICVFVAILSDNYYRVCYIFGYAYYSIDFS